METKAGYKTTEFWFSAIAAIIGMIIASGAVPEGGLAAQIIGGVAAILAQIGYTGSRSTVKKAELNQAVFVEEDADEDDEDDTDEDDDE